MRIARTLVAGAILAGACSDDYTGPGDPPPGPPPTLATVNVQDNQFVAATVTVAAGGTVRWTWQGANPHNVTFNGGQASATQAAGTYEQDFATTGDFPYVCTVHGQAMSGIVRVVAAN